MSGTPRGDGGESTSVSSGLNWTNRGSAGNDLDGLAAVFGTEAEKARNVVEAALATWTKVVPNLNNGINRIDVSFTMSGKGIGGQGGVTAVSDGRPTAGRIDLAGGDDSHGMGYWLDPTPYEHSEFSGAINNAFAGDATTGSPAFGKFDLFTLVLLEASHLLGTAKNSNLRIWTSGLMSNMNITIPTDREEGGTGAGQLPNKYWLFNGNSGKVLFNGSSETGVPSDRLNAVHTSSTTTPPIVYQGNTYYGFEDSNNAFGENGRRYLPSGPNSRFLEDAYGYTIVEPSTFGTFYDRLDGDGTLDIRTRPGNNNDSVELQVIGSNLLVEMSFGSPVPGIDPVSLNSTFPLNSISKIKIDTGTGSDAVTIHPLSSTIPIAVDTGGGGFDVLTVVGSAGYDSIAVDAPTITSTGINITSFAGLSRLDLQVGLGNADVRMPDAGSTPEANIIAQGGDETINLHSLSTNTPVTIFGNGGNDTITLGTSVSDANTINSEVVVLGGTGADQLNIGSGNSDAVASNVTFDGGTGGGNSIVYNDTTPAYVVRYDVFSNRVNRDGFNAPVDLFYSNVATITANGGAGSDTFTIRTGVTAVVHAFGNSGNDSFIIGGGNLNGFFPQDINGGPGTDTITYDDSANPANKTWEFNQISRPNEIIYAGLVSLFTTNFESVGILAGNGADQITFAGQFNQALNIDAGGGTDTFTLGYQSPVLFFNPVMLVGGSQSTTFNINDAQVYFFTTLSMNGATGFLNYLNVNVPNAANFTLGEGYFIPGGGSTAAFSYTNITTAVFNGNSLDNTYTIYSAGSQFGTFTVNGNLGNDSFVLKPQLGGYTFEHLTLDGNQGTDAFTYDASALSTNEIYTIGANSLQRFTGQFNVELITTASVNSLTMTCGSGADIIHVNGVNTARPATINGGGGGDIYNVFGSAFGASAPVSLTLADSAGLDTFNLNDQDLTSASNATYQSNASGITRVGTQVPYTGIDIANINGGAGADILQVLALPASAGELRFFGGAGNDALTTPTSSLNSIANRVRFDGQSGTNTVNLNDSADTSPNTAHIDQFSVGAYPGDNLFGSGGTFHFTNASALTLSMGTGADTVYAQPNSAATISIAANVPFLPGDGLKLALASAANHVVNGTPSNGNVMSSNLKTLSYTGFEGIAIDDITPVVANVDFNLGGNGRGGTPAQSITATFSEDVGALLTSGFLGLTNTTTGEIVPITNIHLDYAADTLTATFSFPGYAGGVLPDGVYKAQISAGYADLFGNAGATSAMYTFVWSAGTSGPDVFRVALNPVGQIFEIYLNNAGTPAFIAGQGTSKIALAGGLGDDILTVDLSSGNSVTPDGIVFDGGDGADTLGVKGSTSANVTMLDATNVTLNNGTSLVPHSNVESFAYDGNGGLDTLHLLAKKVVFSSTQVFNSLQIANNAVAALTPGGNKVLVALNLGIAATGSLDLANNDLIVDYTGASQLASIQSLINSARAGGGWTGPGITSSAAKNTNPRNTTLGVMEASEFKSIYGPSALFAGEAIDSTAVLVKYTYYGDVDFNGVVDFDDYARVDAGFNNNRTGWLNGDVDGNGIVDFDDYSLIDQAFNTQGSALRPGLRLIGGKS
ncbi:MAG: hypothetical protein H7Z14_15270 [Anaerolineae bacterium]|nr:hypothetical protein [Phycisphaerae bacterium]